MKTKKQEREENGRRYGAIDRHYDFIQAGYQTPRHTPKKIIEGLTEFAKRIMDKEKKENA